MNVSSFAFNTSACVAHRVHDAIIEASVDPHASVGELATLHALPYFLLAASVIVSCFGHMLLRPSIALISFCLGGAACLHVTLTYAEHLHNWNCESIVIASLAAAAVLALVSVSLVRSLSTLLGVCTGSAFAILLFDVCSSCNEPFYPNAATFLQRTLVPFWLTLVTFAALGGWVCRRKHALVIALVTALIGGWGVAASVRLLANGVLVQWAFLLITFSASLIGFGSQYKIMRRRRATKGKAPEVAPSTV